MRSNTLLFFHVFLAMSMVGGLIASAVAAFAAHRREDAAGDMLRRVAWRTALVTVPVAIAAVELGELSASDEDIEATWLDVSRGLAMFGLLVGGIVLTVLARAARSRPRLTKPTAFLALALVVIALTVAFLMSAKPS
jgi:cytochrome bd-type quinol oxidase subunit 1